MLRSVWGQAAALVLLASCGQPSLDTAVVDLEERFGECSFQFPLGVTEARVANAGSHGVGYVAKFEPDLIGVDELWCEYEGTLPGVADYIFVVAPEMSSDLLRRLAVSHFGSYLKISSMETAEAGAVRTGVGRIDVRGDSPGFFSISAVDTSAKQAILVLVAESSDRSPATGEPLGELSYELLVAFLESYGVQHD